MAKPLTRDYLLSKSKHSTLAEIKNVNLWGNDIADVSIFRELPNVEIVSMSINKIESLKDFAACSKLKELYLRKNQVSDLSEVHALAQLPHLTMLWLSNNPCANHLHYRLYVIKTLPGLLKLDNIDITSDERN
jgi:cilla- and flagella-associated protein